jgi:hypothetical protein
MVKKIKLDFSKVEERSGWNTKQMPEGLHKMKIADVQETEAQDGTAMLVYALVPEDSRYKMRRFPFYCKLQQNQLWKLRDLFVAAGETIPKRAVQIDPSKVVGKSIAAEVEDDNYQGNPRSAVNGTYGLDVLDEDGASEPEDDEEEYDEEDAEDDSADEEYEDEEDDEEYDDEDEDDLDDEDLDDEELYEDDEDEEEEEPEPAPKRRAPAKKAPAKPAAKAAPAKRTVQRRR